MTADFDPLRTLEILSRHGVRFVVVGGFAAMAQGSPLASFDLDICYARDAANLDRLADAIAEVDAYPRGWPPGLPFTRDRTLLENQRLLNLETTAGDLDLLAEPAGVNGYDELMRGAVKRHVEGREVWFASVPDLIRMKRAAGRAKDQLGLLHLTALQEEIDARAEDR